MLNVATGGARTKMGPQWRILVHGGAGNLRPEAFPPERERAHLAGLEAALEEAARVLRTGGGALDAVEAAVCELEDCPLFNAGHGSVLRATGEVLLDASIMNGPDLRVGAVAGVRTVRNPVSLARAVMEHAGVSMLRGREADAFAREQGLAITHPAWFITDERRRQLEDARRAGKKPLLDHESDAEPGANTGTSADPEADPGSDPDADTGTSIGTVGAVALDSRGGLAAATSTGGLCGAPAGRIADSAIIGAGTYADARCAVSCTGQGDYFIRAAAAGRIAHLYGYGGRTLAEAARETVSGLIAELGGRGGVIALARDGAWHFEFTTRAMFRGHLDSDGQRLVAIFR